MSDRLKALREERGKIVKAMRDLTEKAEKEKRDLSDEEFNSHSTMWKNAEDLRKKIEIQERDQQLDREAAEAEARQAAENRGKDKATGGRGGDSPEAEKEARELRAFAGWLERGMAGLTEEERRDLNAGAGPDGQYTVAPEAFVARLIQWVDDLVFIRRRATKFTMTNAVSIGIPSLDTDPSDADWTTELATGANDTAMAFGKREMAPQPLAKRIKISKKLLRQSSLPIVNIVMQRLAYKFAISQEKAHLTGDGDKKPLGLFTASNSGIPTSRDVSTGNTTTALTFDGIIEAKFAVKSQYWGNADWLFHRDAVKMLTKIRDNEDQYIWRMSVREGEPDSLLGRPMMISEYVPNTFTSGLYVGMFGDFSHYWIVDALDMQMQRLTELYAESNQDGFIGRLETDGQPVLPEAFARIKLATG